MRVLFTAAAIFGCTVKTLSNDLSKTIPRLFKMPPKIPSGVAYAVGSHQAADPDATASLPSTRLRLCTAPRTLWDKVATHSCHWLPCTCRSMFCPGFPCGHRVRPLSIARLTSLRSNYADYQVCSSPGHVDHLSACSSHLRAAIIPVFCLLLLNSLPAVL